MKRLLLAILLLCAAGPALAQTPVARLAGYSGEVNVIRDGRPQALYPDFPLQNGDTVSTRQGLAIVRFPDKTEIRVRPESKVGISERAESRDISLFVGRLWSFIAKAKDHPTNFRSGGTIAAVRGTEIEFLANPDGSVEIGVDHGVLTIKLADGTEVTLVAGQRIAIGADGKPGPIEEHHPGDIAAIGGEVKEIPDGQPFILTRVIGVEGNNPFDPQHPASQGAEAVSPTPTPEPTPEATPTPEPTPGGTPEPTPSPEPTRTACSNVPLSPCGSTPECCRPYQCIHGECCRLVAKACSPANSRADCCSPGTCAFSQRLGIDACCFPQGERCEVDLQCCDGSCLNGRCAPGCIARGQTCGRDQRSCCEGLVCNDGVCGDPTCAQLNQPCPPPVANAVVNGGPLPCCEGLYCLGGQVQEYTCKTCIDLGGYCDPGPQRGRGARAFPVQGAPCCGNLSCEYVGEGGPECCRPNGQSCGSGSECCSLNCSRGTCCNPDGYYCNSPSECCSNICSFNTCGGGGARAPGNNSPNNGRKRR